MRLVLLYTVGDGCSYSADVVLPFEHESLESAYCELDEEIRKHECLTKIYPDEFEFSDHTLRRSDFYYYNHNTKRLNYNPPEVLTLDQWYERPRH